MTTSNKFSGVMKPESSMSYCGRGGRRLGEVVVGKRKVCMCALRRRCCRGKDPLEVPLTDLNIGKCFCNSSTGRLGKSV